MSWGPEPHNMRLRRARGAETGVATSVRYQQLENAIEQRFRDQVVPAH